MNKNQEKSKNSAQINLLDLLVNSGFTAIGILLASKRNVRDRGHKIKLLLHLFKGFENDAG